MEIKFAHEKDLDAWMALVRQVQEVFPGLETQEAMEAHKAAVLRFMDNASAICAVEANRIVGVLLFSRKTNELCFLAVDPAHRRQHIAQSLAAFMLTQMDEGKDVTLLTYQEGNPNGAAARALYKRLGFSEGNRLEKFGRPVQEFVLKRGTGLKKG